MIQNPTKACDMRDVRRAKHAWSNQGGGVNGAGTASAVLNSSLPCSFLDVGALRDTFNRNTALSSLAARLPMTHPHLFSPSPVFVSPDDLKTIRSFVSAFQRLVQTPAYQTRVLGNAPSIARHIPETKGVFYGFDFHLSDDGPKLIEINTNAGGAVLNWALLEAQRACCDEAAALMTPTAGDDLMASWLRMLKEEAGGNLRHLAIIDQEPETQYLFPEFLLLQEILAGHGIKVSILDPSGLTWSTGKPAHSGEPIDLIYNRLTDFYLGDEAHTALAKAYLDGTARITPHPRAHALYANKENLASLCDGALLQSAGLASRDRLVIRETVPLTMKVSAGNADDLWKRRKAFFFKPAHGFASRAAYRGDKVTTRVWADIVAGGFIAQQLIAPPRRLVPEAGTPLKFDIRAYAYDGEVQLLAARLYDGQTTNFRTAFGGFAAVFVSPAL